MTELLFSYGTVQLEKVQMESFGRKLSGTKEVLNGYTTLQVKITDKDVLTKSELEFHPVAVPTSNKNDMKTGRLYKITPRELTQADTYEVSDYKRIKTTFESGRQGWIYVKS